jgi:hypothetical protein
VKRREVDKALTMLLDRIDGELAEIRDAIIEIDHRAGLAHAQAVRAATLAIQCDPTLTALDNADHSRRVEP